jgi:hypothetical protein
MLDSCLQVLPFDSHPTQIDVRLVPIMAVLYLLSHIDRANIGNAKIEGMDKDLDLTGNQYNIATTLFFIPYIIFGMCNPFSSRST